MRTKYPAYTLLHEVDTRIKNMSIGDEVELKIKDPKFVIGVYAKNSSVVSTAKRVANEKGWRSIVTLTKGDKFPVIRRLA